MFNDGEWGVIILAHCNENFNDLQGAYLFAKIRKEQETYKANYPDADIISLGIGDVTQPLARLHIQENSRLPACYFPFIYEKLKTPQKQRKGL